MLFCTRLFFLHLALKKIRLFIRQGLRVDSCDEWAYFLFLMCYVPPFSEGPLKFGAMAEVLSDLAAALSVPCGSGSVLAAALSVLAEVEPVAVLVEPVLAFVPAYTGCV